MAKTARVFAGSGAGLLLLLWTTPLRSVGNASPATETIPAVRVVRFEPEKPINRAGRLAPVMAVIQNAGDAAVRVQPVLTLSKGMAALHSVPNHAFVLEPGASRDLRWDLKANLPGERVATLHLNIRRRRAGATGNLAGDDMISVVAALNLRFLPAVTERKLTYIPEPQPVATSLLIGAHNCPLWETDHPELWANVRKHPERTPALGYYGQENPEVADWETRWALEHGISFFIYCWYRSSQGGPVKIHFGSAIHQALFHSRFRNKLKFTIMWENQSRGTAGVSDEKDLLTNLLPFWIESYFKRPDYLKVDNKPVLFIYRPEFLIQDLGSVENVARAFTRMREACRAAGFAGLTILGEYRGLDPGHLTLMKQLGLDYTFAYCWGIGNNPNPQRAIDTQMQDLQATRDLHILPEVATVSQGWSGWADEGSIWKIPPPDYEQLLRRAKVFVGTLPKNELGSRMLLLDNWNEWGEGHYIAPHREFGFGYLDAVRKVFSSGPAAHQDLIPEDIGLGPYDTVYRAAMKHQEQMRGLLTRRVTRPGASEEGLLGWWTFDEKPGSPAAFDYSGHGIGGELLNATRAPGISGSALVCKGGCVIVDNSPILSPTRAMSLECWVKTGVAGQDNRWFINRVFGGGTATGYRMGVLGGKPCFEIPQTDWSHHLVASRALPTGRWIYLVGTFDGRTMRIYVDGEQQGTMERPGPIHPNEFHLCLGNFEEKHPAYFDGLLDEVKLYNRALNADEVLQHYRSRL